ncbi:MAG: Isoleucine--tRNA ligase [Candidatus Moanabacter tarae]|uniref:Isoleucine--tRNA ligase n=1 Tax=Candidatus Moanibacter tarae TaxID=2200854 RepID=A0A2Z4APM9_9BACT|nr:MAG: Isoleucine--tRNA ligase [Candidatus Moanabacter tarae]|tara:strand:- start:11568 stop:14375 length:2808 start_codon:yes stop_codon:yes gene_type:complete
MTQLIRNYKDTLNLPDTAFPMRANSVQREPERIAHWDKIDLYRRIQEKNAAGKNFILHDGPPYANGNIHLGHALNKILKDIILRYKSMRGYSTPYVPGWDCHGLPIEQQVFKEVGDRIHTMSPTKIRGRCHNYASKYIEIQKKQFKRLGILGEWEAPYCTFDPEFEVGILQCFRELVAKGLVRKGFKVVHWDPIFRTAIAEAEVEYHSHQSDSIFVRFPLFNPERFDALKNLPDVALVVWTTTPWTLPANEGVCLHPSFEYVAVSHEGRTSIVAAERVDAFIEDCGITDGTIVGKISSNLFDRSVCQHPIFSDRTSLIMLGNHVTMDQGTGCVHTAPGHGTDDFAIAQKYKLPISVPVDAKGCFTDDYSEMSGEFVFDANPKIIRDLKERGLLVAASQITHDYPFSWRSKKPIIFRATEQWFMEFEEGSIRQHALDAIESTINWIPQWGYERIRNMIRDRPDWCLSRQRSWGVPIPSIRSKASGNSVLELEVIDRFIDAVKSKGTDCWFTDPIESFLPPGFTYKSTGESNAGDFEKETDVLDVWFDSGSSHIAVLEGDDRLSSPADLYLEGSDQHRGWFQSSLLTSIGARNQAPYKAVLTHGFILDGEGNAMSKSLGNVVSPLDIINKSGGDILRLWVASVDYRNDIRLSEEIISHVVETYRTIRNTLRFQLGNLFDFDPEKDLLEIEELLPLDRWALYHTSDLVESVQDSYEEYEFQRIYQLINRFTTVTLSATYHDILKDRLYTLKPSSKERRSAQTTIYHINQILTRLIAPILVFTADESGAHSIKQGAYAESSIHLQEFPNVPMEWKSGKIPQMMEEIMKVRIQINESLENLRKEKTIGQSLEAEVEIKGSVSNKSFQILKKFEEFLPEIFIVSKVYLVVKQSNNSELSITVKKATGNRCLRCWRWAEEVSQDHEESPVCGRCITVLNDRS